MTPTSRVKDDEAMIDLQNFMLKLADAAKSGSTHNQVYVYREVLTKVYLLGHEDGMRDASRDDFVRSEIESVVERAAKEAHDD